MSVIKISWKDSGDTIVKAVVGKVTVVSGATGSGLHLIEDSLNPARYSCPKEYIDVEIPEDLIVRPVMAEVQIFDSIDGHGDVIVESVRSYIYAHDYSKAKYNRLWGFLTGLLDDTGLYLLTNLAKVSASGVDSKDVLTFSFPEAYMDTETQAFFVTTLMSIQKRTGCTVILVTRSPDCVQAASANGKVNGNSAFFWYGYSDSKYKFFGTKISGIFKELNKSLDLIESILDEVEDDE